MPYIVMCHTCRTAELHEDPEPAARFIEGHRSMSYHAVDYEEV